MNTNRIISTNKGHYKIDINTEEGVVYAVNIGDENWYYTMPLEMADKSNEEIAEYINEIK